MNGILSGGVRDEFPYIKSKFLFDARLLGGELHSFTSLIKRLCMVFMRCFLKVPDSEDLMAIVGL